MFYVYLKGICILLLLGGVLYKSQLGKFGLYCFSGSLYLYWFSVYLFCQWLIACTCMNDRGLYKWVALIPLLIYLYLTVQSSQFPMFIIPFFSLFSWLLLDSVKYMYFKNRVFPPTLENFLQFAQNRYSSSLMAFSTVFLAYVLLLMSFIQI